MWKWGKGKRRVKRMYIRFTQSTTYIMCSRRGFLKHSENLSSSRFGASNAQLLIRACRRFSLASDLLRFIRSVVLPSLTSRVVRFALKTILRFPFYVYFSLLLRLFRYHASFLASYAVAVGSRLRKQRTQFYGGTETLVSSEFLLLEALA